jgi:YggT family protein
MTRRGFFRRDADRPLVDEDARPRDRVVYDEPRDSVVRHDGGQPVRRTYADDAYVDDAPVARESVVEQRQTAMHSRSLRSMLDGLVMLALLALEVLLAVRFALIAFGANTNSSFTNFIMNISGPIVRPFRDTFTLHTWDRGVLDYNILLAMGVWFIAGILLMMVINAVVPDTTDNYRMDRRRRVTHG